MCTICFHAELKRTDDVAFSNRRSVIVNSTIELIFSVLPTVADIFKSQSGIWNSSYKFVGIS